MKKFLSLLMTLAVIGGVICMPISAQANTPNTVTAASVARIENCPSCGPVVYVLEKTGREYDVKVRTEYYDTFRIEYYEVRQDYVRICPGCGRYLGFAYSAVVRTYTKKVYN